MVTIKEIAEQAGVSRGTVDRVLNNRGKVDPEKERVIRKIAEELGYVPNAAGRGLAARKKNLHFGFIYPKGRMAPFFGEVLAGAKETAAELASYGVRTSFYPLIIPDTLPPAAGDAAYSWLSVIENAIFQDEKVLRETDGWVMPGPMIARMEEAYQAIEGLEVPPAVAYNLEDETGGRLAYVGCDYIQSGRLAAGLAALMSGGRGNVGFLSMDPGNIDSSAARKLGFLAECDDSYPGMHVTFAEMYRDQDTEADVIDRVVREIEETKTEILYLANPSDYLVCREICSRLQEQYRTIRFITNDLASEEQLQMLRSGEIEAAITQEPLVQGQKPLEILFDLLALGKRPEKDWYRTRLGVHLRQNV